MNYKALTTNCLQLVVVILFATFAIPVSADVLQRQKITSEPRGVGAQFGNAIAVDGNTMVVGARFDSTTASQAGAAFVYVLNGNTWTQQAKLLASDGAVADKFGYSVAISGDTIVVGAFNDDSPLSNAGSAYVFVRSGTTWTQQQRLTANDAAADQEFGNAVAITGNTIFVGEHFADLPGNSEAGAVYIYTRSGTFWTQIQKLLPAGGVILGDHFGEALAVSGNKLVVGAPGTDIPFTAAGSVYVFVESGGAYLQQDKISIPDGKNGDSFGSSVAIEGNTLVGGALQWTPIVAQPAYGAAYVFEFNGSTWSSQGRLIATDGATVDRFGYSVAVSNNVVAVGAREDDTTAGGDAGSAYLFTRSGATWTQQQKIDPDDSLNGDRFGVSVALRSGTLIVGAAEKALTSPNGQGAVYTFSAVRPVFPDFDGDGKADISIFRQSSETWFYLRSSDSGFNAVDGGSAGDMIAAADFDGDGKTDFGVFNAAGAGWYIKRSTAGLLVQQFGATGDLPMPADYDGDGKADFCVFRPSTGEWIRTNSSNNQNVTEPFGLSGDKPLLGDFDGDGKNDIAVYRPAGSNWFIHLSTGTVSITQFGLDGDVPVPADYDGDGKTDIAVYRPSTGTWFIRRSFDSTNFASSWGASTDIPAAADFDGDGKADLAIFRPASGTWFILQSTAGVRIVTFGVSTDLPVPLYFIRQTGTPSSLQFSTTNYSVTEDPTSALITVNRSGDTSSAVSVSYATSDGTANQSADYSTSVGTLHFASGETSKTISVPITEDSFVEGTETVTLTLSSPSLGAVLGSPNTATLSILNDDTQAAANPIDTPSTYVGQHYHDFLNRQADAPGLAFWTNEITSCGSDTHCVEVKRVNVSAAYFLSIEFQQTGYLVYRFYNAALNRSNGLPRYAEFLHDTQRVGSGVVVNATGWEAQLEANKAAYADEFVASSEFTTLYPLSQTPSQFVDALYAHAGIVPTAAQRQAAIDEFNTNPVGAQARVLRRVADNPTLVQREFNRAFVLMQYFGYLRRNPDDAPDNNLSGFNFWLGKLNQFNGDYVGAEMVKAFILSGEYRSRFGQ